MQRKIFYLLLLFAICPVLLTAGTKGRIKGKVVDLQSGEALIGANVVVEGSSFGANTDANGDFTIPNLEAGVYTLRASYVGYKTVTMSNVRVNADLTQYVSFQLPSQDIQVGTIDIVAQKPIIQKDNTNAVRITTAEDIQALPVRSVNTIVGLTAGVTQSNGNTYIRGGRNDENGYYLEGVSIKSPLSGGRDIRVSQDALEEIQVQTGGYTAEFGNANAGIIRQAYKSGGTQLRSSFEYITDNINFNSKNKAYDGTQRLGANWYGYDESSFVLSGPLFDQRFKFFVNANYRYDRDNNSQALPGMSMGFVGDASTKDTVNITYPAGARPHNQQDSYNFTGTLNMDLKPFIVRLAGNYSMDRNDAGAFGIQNLLNTRVGEQKINNGTVSLKVTQALSDKIFYEVSAGYMFRNAETYDRYLDKDPWVYGDSVANANAGWVWARKAPDLRINGTYFSAKQGRYKRPQPYTIMDWGFTQDGVVPVNYAKSGYNAISLNGAVSMLLGKYHSIKLGGEYQKYSITNWSTPYVASSALAELLDTQLKSATNAGKSVDQVKQAIMMNYGVDNYGYDLLGNEYTGDGFFAAHKPVFASAFITDKIEYEDLIINVGLRFDYFDIDNKQMIDPSNPALSINKSDKTLIESGWTNVPTFSAVSPRIGFSFPVTENTVFHAQYGKFVQQPALNQTYIGYQRYAYMLIQGNSFGDAFVGPNLRPTRTTQYEIGFNQKLTDFLAFDITGYYRDIKDQAVYMQLSTDQQSGYGNYFIKGNGDFATTKGIEIALTMRRYQRLSMNGSLSFQDARGTGSFPGGNRGIVESPVVPGQPFLPKYISPLEFQKDLTARLNIDYRFGDNDGGKVLQNLGASILMRYESGRPYTLAAGDPRAVGNSQPLSGDQRFRLALEPLNASTMPSTFTVDLRIDKTFKLLDKLSANVYIFVINLFDTKNVQNVFLSTGSADDDGFVSNPANIADKLALYGNAYKELYNGINIDNASFLYGESRQVRFGIRLEY